MKLEVAYSFKKQDGMVSHVKFLKNQGGGGNYIFFVRDTQYIVRLNLVSKELEEIGRVSDSVIAFNVAYNKLRFKDRQLKAHNNAVEDLEQQEGADD